MRLTRRLCPSATRDDFWAYICEVTSEPWLNNDVVLGCGLQTRNGAISIIFASICFFPFYFFIFFHFAAEGMLSIYASCVLLNTVGILWNCDVHNHSWTVLWADLDVGWSCIIRRRIYLIYLIQENQEDVALTLYIFSCEIVLIKLRDSRFGFVAHVASISSPQISSFESGALKQATARPV